MIIDTHAHYDDEAFSQNLPELISEMQTNGVDKILTCATGYDNCEKVISLCKKYENMYCAVGIYPHETDKQGEFNAKRLVDYCSEKSVVAIGEIGLDYYYDDTPREIQLDWAQKQIILANSVNLPITFHDRQAHADSLELFKKHTPKGVVHCYSGSYETAKEIVSLGLYLGVGGAITFKNARTLPEVVEKMPLSCMVLETDAPYMSPVPFRGKPNRSDYIFYIAQRIADIKKISVEQVLKVTSENAVKIFKFGEK